MQSKMKDPIKNFKQNLTNIERKLKPKRIVVMSGGFGEEREASIYTASEVFTALKNHKFNVLIVDPTSKNIFKILNPKNDIVFNCLHGVFGESGHLPAILDYLKIPYTFSGIYASTITMDKIYFSGLLKKLRLNYPQDNIDNPKIIKRSSILIFKKIRGGGSIDMYLAKNSQVSPNFFAQEFIENAKILTLGILESDDTYIPLEIIEVKLKGKKFYDKESKYEEGLTLYQKYNGSNKEIIFDFSLRLFKLLNIKGAARIDFIEKDGKVYILEINSVPGLYEGSNLAFSAELKGLSFYELLIWLLNSAQFEKLS